MDKTKITLAQLYITALCVDLNVVNNFSPISWIKDY